MECHARMSKTMVTTDTHRKHILKSFISFQFTVLMIRKVFAVIKFYTSFINKKEI